MKKIINLMLVVLALFFSSCSSQPPYKVDQVPISSFYGKTVFVDIGMAEWSRQILPLIDAAIYNNGLDKIVQEFNIQQNRKISELQKQLTEHYNNVYEVEVVSGAYPPIAEKLDIDYFKKPNKEVSDAIASICRYHEAEYVITLIGQMQTLRVSTFGINGENMLSFNMVLFDKEGNIITKGEVRSTDTRMGSGEIDKFIALFDNAGNLLKSMISEIGLAGS